MTIDNLKKLSNLTDTGHAKSCMMFRVFIQNKIENIFIMNYNPNKHDDFHLKTTNKLFQHVDKVFSVIQ